MAIRAYKLVLDQAEIKAVLSDDVGKDVAKTTLRVLNRSKVLCPVDTGNLRASIQFELIRRPDRITGEVGTKVKYALPVHNGVRARFIYPNEKKALAFDWKGRHWVLARVHQKARRGRPFLLDALREVAEQEGYKFGRGVAGIDPSVI